VPLLPQQPNARELSPEEAEERAERCYKLEQGIKRAMLSGREAMWDLARNLHEFDEESGWTALGYDSLKDWLADPEVGLSRATFFRLVQTYRELAVRRQLPEATLGELEVSKVQIILPKLKAGSVKLTDAIEDVKTLGARDLRSKYLRRPDPADLEPPDDGDGLATTQRASSRLNVETDEPVVGDIVEATAAQDAINDATAEAIVDAEVVEAEDGNPTTITEPGDSGGLTDAPAVPEGPSAADVIEWIDRALPKEASLAMKRHALTVARKFVIGVFPQADPAYEEAAQELGDGS
jgi:hypothetical protein